MYLSAMLPGAMFRRPATDVEDAGVLAAGKAAGLDGVEVHGSPRLAPRLPVVRRLIGEAGLVLSCYIVAVDYIHDDATARRQTIDDALRLVDQGAEAGAPLVLLVPGTLKPGMTVARAHQHIVEGLRRCLDRARRLGLTLTMENHGIQAAIYGTSAHLATLLAGAGPQMRVTYDVGNFLLAGEDPLAALASLAPLIAHVHLKNWVAVPPEAPPLAHHLTGLDGRRWASADLAEGVIDIRAAIAALESHGYRGHLSIERGGPDFVAGMRDSAAYLRAALARPR